MPSKITTSPLTPTPRKIISSVAQAFGVTVDDLTSHSRTKNLATARLVAMALIRELTNLSLSEIGTHFPDRHHTTIIHAVKRLPQIESHIHYASLVHLLRIKLTTRIKVSKTSVQTLEFRADFLNSNLTHVSGYTHSLSP